MRKGAVTTGRVLQRCSLCKKFHAAYLVEDEKLATLKLCRDCWNERLQQEKQDSQDTSSSPL